MERYILIEYTTGDGNSSFSNWFNGLKDKVAKAAVLTRLQRLRLGNPGDVKPVGEGVHELRIMYGPGYRVYFAYQSDSIVILLAGSSKKDQPKIIQQALIYWRQCQ